MVAAGVAGAIVLAPQISTSKREAAAREREQLTRMRAAERRRLEAEQRPVRGRAPGASRAEIVRVVEAAVSSEASRRVARGELPTPVRRGECELIGQERGRARVSCVAVTSDIPATSESRAGSRAIRSSA